MDITTTPSNSSVAEGPQLSSSIPWNDRRQQIIGLLAGFSLEVTPAEYARFGSLRGVLRSGTDVSITFLPGGDFESVIDTARGLAREGLNPIPHLAARSIPSYAALDEYLARLTETASVNEVLVMGGGVKRPVGAISESMQILESGLLEKHGIERIGIAGHPEGNPDVGGNAELEAALMRKNRFAESTAATVHIVTQFCFESEPIITWDRKLREAGNRLPLHVGIPGLTLPNKLIAYAKMCGVGPSIRVLTRNKRYLTRLSTPVTPDKLIMDLADYQASDPACGIRRAHFYPLGALERTVNWLYAIQAGHFSPLQREPGFKVDRRWYLD